MSSGVMRSRRLLMRGRLASGGWAAPGPVMGRVAAWSPFVIAVSGGYT
jgi:hypothetical protein